MKRQKAKGKRQNFLLVIFLVFIFLSFLPNLAMAQCPTEGFVPCGTEGCPCQLCHFFVMFERIIDFVLFKLVPPIAILMLVIGGVMFFFAGGSPGALTKAKSIITATVIGLIITYAAWLLIGMFFAAIGMAETEFGTAIKDWFTIECEITP